MEEYYGRVLPTLIRGDELPCFELRPSSCR
jgi:hypothetical protein